MSKFEEDYQNLIKKVLKGEVTTNRTGIDAITIFNTSMNINLREGFPILTGKKMFFDKAYHEFIWFIEGMVTTTYLKANGIHWWDEYADKNGNLGKTYGYQLRKYNGEFDQLEYAINEIRNNSRRAHITLWNPSELNQTALPVCYTGFDFVRINDTLHMSMDFRSSDVFLGLPYDIIVGALMLHKVAKHCDLRVGMLGINLKNAHIYENHLIQVNEYLNRDIFELPKYSPLFNEVRNKLINYKHGAYIHAPLNL
jgi:thymidylate synthase